MDTIQILENSSELGAGIRGASLGIEAIRMAAINQESDFFHRYPIQRLPHQNDLLFDPQTALKTRWALQIEGILQIYQTLETELSKLFLEGDFPIILSGDHSSAGGTIAAIRTAFPQDRLGVIWIDAHADLHTPYTTPSGNVHGMPLAAALGLDGEARQLLKRPVNELSPESTAAWNQLKAFGGPGANLSMEDIVFVSVRDVEREEAILIQEHKIPNHTVEMVRMKGTEKISQDIRKQLAHCDRLYISFDVDSMDCNILSHGTGTPVPNGLFEYEANNLIQHLLQDPRITCLEFTEINPLLDEKGNAMADAAFRILEGACRVMERNLSFQIQ